MVSDTSILIELIRLDLLECFFRLKFLVTTSTFVVVEVNDKAQIEMIKNFVAAGMLRVDSPDERQLSVAVDLFQKGGKLSLTDCCVIELATRTGATVLTSDQRLKEESEHFNVRCNGLLFIIEQMVNSNLIDKSQGVAKLQMHSNGNRRAPKRECLALVELWKS